MEILVGLLVSAVGGMLVELSLRSEQGKRCLGQIMKSVDSLGYFRIEVAPWLRVHCRDNIPHVIYDLPRP